MDQVITPEFVTRHAASVRLGKNRRTLIDNELRWGLRPLLVNGVVSYTVENVDSVAAKWRSQALTPAIPPGWTLLIGNARGPFIGEYIPEAPKLAARLDRSPDLQKFPELYRWRRCIVSYVRLDEAFRVAEEEKLNVICNGRGIVAVKEN